MPPVSFWNERPVIHLKNSTKLDDVADKKETVNKSIKNVVAITNKKQCSRECKIRFKRKHDKIIK